MTTQSRTATVLGQWRPADTFASRVVLIRYQLGLRQDQFAALTGLRRGELQGIEKGRAVRDQIAKATKIAAATGVDRDWLAFGGELSGPDEGPTREDLDRIAVALKVTNSYPYTHFKRFARPLLHRTV